MLQLSGCPSKLKAHLGVNGFPSKLKAHYHVCPGVGAEAVESIAKEAKSQMSQSIHGELEAVRKNGGKEISQHWHPPFPAQAKKQVSKV